MLERTCCNFRSGTGQDTGAPRKFALSTVVSTVWGAWANEDPEKADSQGPISKSQWAHIPLGSTVKMSLALVLLSS